MAPPGFSTLPRKFLTAEYPQPAVLTTTPSATSLPVVTPRRRESRESLLVRRNSSNVSSCVYESVLFELDENANGSAVLIVKATDQISLTETYLTREGHLSNLELEAETLPKNRVFYAESDGTFRFCVMALGRGLR